MPHNAHVMLFYSLWANSAARRGLVSMSMNYSAKYLREEKLIAEYAGTSWEAA